MLLYTSEKITPLETEVIANIEEESAETKKVRPEALDILVQTERTMRAMDETNHAFKEGPCLILYIPSRLEPVKLWTKARITLGRKDKRQAVEPTVDLTHDYGYRLGVSRLHAEIFYHDGSYHIRDLGSSNGTWVNSQQVVAPAAVPIQYGDSIRLGHMVIQVG
jgi:pSer/pThr/pTyr-binding forkhead associated (FHA) protein